MSATGRWRREEWERTIDRYEANRIVNKIDRIAVILFAIVVIVLAVWIIGLWE